MNKKTARLKRARRFRSKHREHDNPIPKLVVHRSLNHIYAQIIMREDKQSFVRASLSTLDKEFKSKLKGTKTDKAIKVGEVIASKAKKAGITRVAFDRSGFKYHGRIKALAESARKAGLIF